MPIIRWPNGEINEATTWGALFDLVQEAQWRTMSKRRFRRVMARRAVVWSNMEINKKAPPEAFFEELERAGMLQIIGHRQRRRGLRACK